MASLRNILMLIAALACACGASAQSKYDNAMVKAERFFRYKEWGSAVAMCNLMIAERPHLAESYARGIVAYEMQGDTIRPMELLDRAMRYGVPLDSLLTGVQRQSYAVGRGSMYENFMLQAARENKWMERPLDAYLLRYYAMRQNGPQMVAYAQRMLRGAPRDIRFLHTLANGYMLTDQPELAIRAWQNIIDIDPRNFDALLSLANLADMNGKPDEAIGYFRRAYRVKATPYVAERLKELSAERPR